MTLSRIALLSIVLTACGDSGPAASSPEAAAAKPTAQSTYVCPMHPEVTSTDPKAKCSECGMDLVKKDDKKGATDHAGHGH